VTVRGLWELRRLGELVKLTSGQSPSSFRFGSFGKPYFKVDQLGKASKYLSWKSTPYLSQNIPDVPAGSVLIAKRGAAIAHNRVRILSEPGFMDTNVMALTPFGPLDSEFLYYWLSYRGLWDVADVTSVPQINNKHINPLEIALPSPAEQRTITGALTDADSLITTFERFMDKKLAIKQGMMQQLLTGRTRLPGYHAEWISRPLESVIGRLQAGVSVNSVSDPSPYSVLKTSCVADGNFDPSESKAVAPSDIKRVKVSPDADSLIISRMNTPALVGEVGYVAAGYPTLFLPDRLWLATKRSEQAVHMRWLSYVLSSAQYRDHLKEIATGTSGSMKNIARAAFLGISVQFPPVDEQIAIAETLIDLDSELQTLAVGLAKAQAIKQGMMQQLLTGRTRLPAPEAAA
jgi:type I restriction enzyme, S subunit